MSAGGRLIRPARQGFRAQRILMSPKDTSRFRGRGAECPDRDNFMAGLKSPRLKNAILEDHARLVEEMEARDALDRDVTGESE